MSLTNIADTLQRTRRTPADYVLVEIAAQLLAIEYRRLVELKPDPEDCALPWRRETRACVFDYCDNRADTGKKLMEPKLCDHCRAVLGDAHVRQSVIDASVGMVRSAVAPRMIAILWELSGNPNRADAVGWLAIQYRDDDRGC